MREGFEVDLVALAMRREEFSGSARTARDLPVQQAVRATPTGVSGTDTAAAAQDLAYRLGVAVGAFADVVGELADRLDEVERVYTGADTDASEQLEQVLGPWAQQ